MLQSVAELAKLALELTADERAAVADTSYCSTSCCSLMNNCHS